MERVELEAQIRTVQGKKVKRLRTESWIPAVVYGPDTPPKPIQIQERSLFLTMRHAGSTSLINLRVDGESKSFVVLARDIQRDPITGRLQHVDFYQVRLTEKVKTQPRLVLVGEAAPVREGRAVLIQSMNEVEVECLPTDLIDSIEVDISGLMTLDDNIFVSALPVPPGVTILADPDEVVVSLVTTRMEIEEEVEEPEIEEVEFGEVQVEEEIATEA